METRNRTALALAMDEVTKLSRLRSFFAGLAQSVAVEKASLSAVSKQEVPSLMWLLAEDGATEQSHMRVCDRTKSFFYVFLNVCQELCGLKGEAPASEHGEGPE